MNTVVSERQLAELKSLAEADVEFMSEEESEQFFIDSDPEDHMMLQEAHDLLSKRVAQAALALLRSPPAVEEALNLLLGAAGT